MPPTPTPHPQILVTKAKVGCRLLTCENSIFPISLLEDLSGLSFFSTLPSVLQTELSTSNLPQLPPQLCPLSPHDKMKLGEVSMMKGKVWRRPK